MYKQLYRKSAEILSYLKALHTGNVPDLGDAPVETYLRATKINLDAIEVRLNYLYNKTHIDVINAVSRVQTMLSIGYDQDAAIGAMAVSMDLTLQELNEIELLLSLNSEPEPELKTYCFGYRN